MHSRGDLVAAALQHHTAGRREMDTDIGAVQFLLNDERPIGNEARGFSVRQMLVVIGTARTKQVACADISRSRRVTRPWQAPSTVVTQLETPGGQEGSDAMRSTGGAELLNLISCHCSDDWPAANDDAPYETTNEVPCLYPVRPLSRLARPSACKKFLPHKTKYSHAFCQRPETNRMWMCQPLTLRLARPLCISTNASAFCSFSLASRRAAPAAGSIISASSLSVGSPCVEGNGSTK